MLLLVRVKLFLGALVGRGGGHGVHVVTLGRFGGSGDCKRFFPVRPVHVLDGQVLLHVHWELLLAASLAENGQSVCNLCVFDSNFLSGHLGKGIVLILMKCYPLQGSINYFVAGE